MNEDEKLVAYIDDRERARYKLDVDEIIIERLDIGDIVIPKLSLVIEIKSSLNDFFNSLYDKRLMQQALKMSKYKNRFLYVKTGIVNYTRLKDAEKKSIETIELKLKLLYNVNMIKVYEYDKMIYSINKLIYMLKNKTDILLDDKLKSFGKLFNDYERYVMSLSVIEGVGVKLARKIAKVYKSYEELLNVKRFDDLDGIGKIKSQRIYDFLHNKHFEK